MNITQSRPIYSMENRHEQRSLGGKIDISLLILTFILICSIFWTRFYISDREWTDHIYPILMNYKFAAIINRMSIILKSVHLLLQKSTWSNKFTTLMKMTVVMSPRLFSKMKKRASLSMIISLLTWISHGSWCKIFTHTWSTIVIKFWFVILPMIVRKYLWKSGGFIKP
jgi:hypothetical protein